MESPPSTSKREIPEWIAYISLGLGVIGLCAWFIPIFGCPVTLGGGVTGYLGRDTEQRTIATVGLVLSVLGFIATIINAIAGAALAVGQF